MTEQMVSIRGTSEGLIIELGSGDLETVLGELDEKIGHSASFFRGGRVALRVGPRVLNRDEIESLGNTLHGWGVTLWAVESDAIETRAAADSLGLETHVSGSQQGAVKVTELTDVGDDGSKSQSTKSASEGLLIRRTLRSGASLVHRGHIVVVGDVNSGAEVVAGGDVVVWGKLRGLVHAGAGGDEGAVVCALVMLPSQLRISSKVAVTPRERAGGRYYPQMAKVRDGEITLESWIDSILIRNRRTQRGLGRLFTRIGQMLGKN